MAWKVLGAQALIVAKAGAAAVAAVSPASAQAAPPIAVPPRAVSQPHAAFPTAAGAVSATSGSVTAGSVDIDLGLGCFPVRPAGPRNLRLPVPAGPGHEVKRELPGGDFSFYCVPDGDSAPAGSVQVGPDRSAAGIALPPVNTSASSPAREFGIGI